MSVKSKWIAFEGSSLNIALHEAIENNTVLDSFKAVNLKFNDKWINGFEYNGASIVLDIEYLEVPMNRFSWDQKLKDKLLETLNSMGLKNEV